MRVKELLEILSQFDPNLPVVINGIEGGVQFPNRVDVVEVMFDVNVNPYCGPHEIYLAEFDYQSPDSKAVYID